MVRFGVRFRLGLGHSRVLARCASGLDPGRPVVRNCAIVNAAFFFRRTGMSNGDTPQVKLMHRGIGLVWVYCRNK